jgi:hypothetical protein
MTPNGLLGLNVEELHDDPSSQFRRKVIIANNNTTLVDKDRNRNCILVHDTPLKGLLVTPLKGMNYSLLQRELE